jgi:FkbM family methyltransferase
MRKVLRQLRASPVLNRPVRVAIKMASRISRLISGQGIARWPIAGKVEVTFEDSTFRMYSECDDSLAAGLYYETDYVEFVDLSFFKQMSKRSKCIVDVGANTGLYDLTAASSNPEAKIFAFEPYYFNFERLKTNCSLNNLNNIVPVGKAVGNCDDRIEFWIPKRARIIDVASTDRAFSSRVYGKDVEWSRVEVEQTSLDSFVQSQLTVTKIDLIKIDVEGHECQVFEGMKVILAEHRPHILFESFVDRDRIEFFNEIARENDLTPYAVMRRGILRLDDGFHDNPDGLNFFLSWKRSERQYYSLKQLDELATELTGTCE